MQAEKKGVIESWNQWNRNILKINKTQVGSLKHSKTKYFLNASLTAMYA